MDATALITSGARTVASVRPALLALAAPGPERDDCARAAERGHFQPEEDARVRAWFARYLTARAGLLEVVQEIGPASRGEVGGLDPHDQLRCFAVGYAAAALLVRSGRSLVADVATHTVVQRKLNEGCPEHRIPRKQYTLIYRALTHPANAWRLARAMEFADENRAALDALAGEPALAPVVAAIAEAEDALRLGIRQYLKARARYRWHSYRRRRASAAQQSLFGIAEAFGRVIADVRSPWHTDRVSDDVLAATEGLLRPGDVLVTRHEHALSNLFLPGYWPHAALYLGPAAVRETYGVDVPEPQRGRWVDPLRVLEARKDGVLFRALPDTLAVDAFTVIRPRLDDADVARAIANAVVHESKLYNFDFDFFTSDRLVCTEVVYRAYDGVGGLAFELQRRAGRVTLSAEDLLDMAADDRGFEPVAVFGTPGTGARLVTGAEAREALVASYRALAGGE